MRREAARYVGPMSGAQIRQQIACGAISGQMVVVGTISRRVVHGPEDRLDREASQAV